MAAASSDMFVGCRRWSNDTSIKVTADGMANYGFGSGALVW